VTEQLPNVTFDLSRSFAGNIAVQREGHPNDTLFFWGFENSNGSLTISANESNNQPWGIWLNGGYVLSNLFTRNSDTPKSVPEPLVSWG